jgi:pimeloyl-ACP methyl ester carboxylesterase
VLDLFDQLDVGSATVVGHSMGGLVALEMASADPQRIRNLILVDAGGVPMTQRRLAIILVLLRIGAAIMRRGFIRRALASKAWVRQVALRAGFRDPGVLSPQLAAQIMPVFAGTGFVDSVAASGRAARATAPESIACPVLLVWGEHDAMAPLSCARDMHDRLPDSELAVIGGVGHTPMIESPDEFNRAVLSFTASRR